MFIVLRVRRRESEKKGQREKVEREREREINWLFAVHAKSRNLWVPRPGTHNLGDLTGDLTYNI